MGAVPTTFHTRKQWQRPLVNESMWVDGCVSLLKVGWIEEVPRDGEAPRIHSTLSGRALSLERSSEATRKAVWGRPPNH